MASRKTVKKIAMIVAKLVIVVVVFWFVRDTVLTGFRELRKNPEAFSLDFRWLVLSGVLYLVGLTSAGFFWYRTLHALGQEARLFETLRAYFIGHLGKYVPGKAMVVVLRAGLIRSHRVDTGIAAVSVLFETLTMMSVGSLWAAGVLAVIHSEQWLLCLLSLGLMAAAGLPILPPVFRRIVRLTKAGRSHPVVIQRLEQLGIGRLAEGFLLMSVTWFFLAMSLWAVLRGMNVDGLELPGQIPLYVATVSLAMVAGFLSLIPGGVGVRELILTKLVAPVFGGFVAISSAVLLRLVWLGAELILSGVLYLAGLRKSQTISSHQPQSSPVTPPSPSPSNSPPTTPPNNDASRASRD
ncbi:MAG: lysylphosphatidylglycerol synthase domain-containing protein [Planctomycetia bacterium]|jgi:hypothetical protein